MTKEQIKVCDDAIANPKLEYYGTFSFEKLVDILGNDADANTLVWNGFFDCYVIPKSGVAGGIHSFNTLNERWRNLKRCGSYEKLLENEAQLITQQENKRTLELDFIKEQKEFQKTNNAFIAKQSELIASQLKTNEISQTTNTYIAIFTGVAGAYYLHEFLGFIIPDICLYDKNSIVNILTVISVCGFVLYMLLRMGGRK